MEKCATFFTEYECFDLVIKYLLKKMQFANNYTRNILFDNPDQSL